MMVDGVGRGGGGEDGVEAMMIMIKLLSTMEKREKDFQSVI